MAQSPISLFNTGPMSVIFVDQSSMSGVAGNVAGMYLTSLRVRGSSRLGFLPSRRSVCGGSDVAISIIRSSPASALLPFCPSALYRVRGSVSLRVGEAGASDLRERLLGAHLGDVEVHAALELGRPDLGDQLQSLGLVAARGEDGGDVVEQILPRRLEVLRRAGSEGNESRIVAERRAGHEAESQKNGDGAGDGISHKDNANTLSS